eukprot:gene14223-5241_t
MEVRTSFFILCLVFLYFTDTTRGWWLSRRRRRRCSPTNCQVTGWSSWGTCSFSCGSAGVQSRHRSVTRIHSCGGSCYHLSEARACNRKCCPVNCAWNWGNWGACQGCGTGSRSRTVVVLRNPSCGGTTCPNSRSQSQACNTGSAGGHHDEDAGDALLKTAKLVTGHNGLAVVILVARPDVRQGNVMSHECKAVAVAVIIYQKVGTAIVFAALLAVLGAGATGAPAKVVVEGERRVEALLSLLIHLVGALLVQLNRNHRPVILEEDDSVFRSFSSKPEILIISYTQVFGQKVTKTLFAPKHLCFRLYPEVTGA